MVRRGARWTTAAVLLAGGMMAGGLSAGAPAFAQSLPNPFFTFNDNDDYQQPFVGQPNRYGCIRECLSDFSPCDVPAEKQRDARCKHGS